MPVQANHLLAVASYSYNYEGNFAVLKPPAERYTSQMLFIQTVIMCAGRRGNLTLFFTCNSGINVIYAALLLVQRFFKCLVLHRVVIGWLGTELDMGERMLTRTGQTGHSCSASSHHNTGQWTTGRAAPGRQRWRGSQKGSLSLSVMRKTHIE